MIENILSKRKVMSNKFEMFKLEVERMLDLLQLGAHYRVYINNEYIDDDSLARYNIDEESRILIITLNSKNEAVNDIEDIIEAARHEVLHVLLAPVTIQVQSRTYDPYYLDKEEHRIIAILINTILKEN